MGKVLEEQLSALLDGELPAEEIDLLLARLDRDPGRRATLGRYAMIGECIRTGTAVPGALGVAERVRAALATEAAPVPERRRLPGRARGWMAGALAASVALVAVLRIVPGVPAPAAQAVAGAPALAQAAGLEPLAEVSTVASRRLAPQAATRLTGYLLAHGEYASVISRGNFDSRLVSARAERASWRQPEDRPDAW